MSKRLIFMTIVALLGLMTMPVSAQASSGNPAIYAEHSGPDGHSGEVLFVDADGALSSVPVPAGFYPPGYPATIGLSDIALSKDGTKLAAVFYDRDTSYARQIVIADLTLGSCCVTLAPPLARIFAYDLAGFSPDGTQLAASFAGEAESGDFAFTGGMVIYDVASGEIASQTTMEAPMAARDEAESAVWALMGGWTDAGIQWAPNCYACGGIIQGEFSLWATQKDSFVARSGVFFSLFADVLADTGEMLYASQVEGFPISPKLSMFDVPNVIQYLPGGLTSPFEALETAPVVFFDASVLDLGEGAHWVANGSAFLVTPTDWPQWTLQNREGAQQPIRVAPGARFLTGTTDGWLAAVPNGSNMELVRYVVSAAGAFGAVIERRPAPDDDFLAYRVLYAPALGAGITPVVPPVVTPPASDAIPVTPPLTAPDTTDVITCPGFLPSRLAPGQPARVTPGDPNNLRILPNVSADLVGRIPGGAEFMVIQGPVCDLAGLAWWQVTYDGLTGWTVEGQGSEYFLEPLPAG